MSKIELENAMALRLKFIGAPDWKKGYKFHPKRKWEFDFAWPDLKIAVEVEGGTWKYGRHNRPQGYEADCEKYNAAAELGWRIFRFTGKMIETVASGQMEKVFKNWEVPGDAIFDVTVKPKVFRTED